LRLDPLGLIAGQNSYIYVNDDPINLYDPTGEIVPAVAAGIQYARCVATCGLINVLAKKVGGLTCDLLSEENCWLSCLNPLEWFKLDKLNRILSRKMRDRIEELREGGEVIVESIEEARALLENMPELRPATQERLVPNPYGGMANGFKDPKGTYRGDLINKSDPKGPVHPDVDNKVHGENPHYNIKLPDGDKSAIIIIPKK
jgi:hypothetical protein